jgi:branched-chain amino acid transport system ATP-binding protein
MSSSASDALHEVHENGRRQPQLPALALQDVSVNFGGVRALIEVSLEVTAGVVHGLMGPNGAGKTTLFDVISGVRRPTTGAIALNGQDVTSWSGTRWKVRRSP